MSHLANRDRFYCQACKSSLLLAHKSRHRSSFKHRHNSGLSVATLSSLRQSQSSRASRRDRHAAASPADDELPTAAVDGFLGYDHLGTDMTDGNHMDYASGAISGAGAEAACVSALHEDDLDDSSSSAISLDELLVDRTSHASSESSDIEDETDSPEERTSDMEQVSDDAAPMEATSDGTHVGGIDDEVDGQPSPNASRSGWYPFENRETALLSFWYLKSPRIPAKRMDLLLSILREPSFDLAKLPKCFKAFRSSHKKMPRAKVHFGSVPVTSNRQQHSAAGLPGSEQKISTQVSIRLIPERDIWLIDVSVSYILQTSAFLSLRDLVTRVTASPVISKALNIGRPVAAQYNLSGDRTFSEFAESPFFDMPQKFSTVCSFYANGLEYFIGDNVEIEYVDDEAFTQNGFAKVLGKCCSMTPA